MIVDFIQELAPKFPLIDAVDVVKGLLDVLDISWISLDDFFFFNTFFRHKKMLELFKK